MTRTHQTIAVCLFFIFAAISPFIPVEVAIDSAATMSPLFCPFKWITDIACPTCGLGRALIAAFTWNFKASIDWHPGGIAIYIMTVAWSLVWLWNPECNTIAKRLISSLGSHPGSRTLGVLFMLFYCLWGFGRPV